MRTSILIGVLVLALASSVTAQSDELVKGNWHDGSITLIDETVLTGLVKYDKQRGFASYKDGEEITSYNKGNILYMSFYDERYKCERKFYSLAFDGNAELFEVMAEYKTIVMLSVMGPIRKREKHRRGWDSFSSRDYLPGTQKPLYEEAQIETLYIMNSEGTMKPYMDIVHREDGEVSLFTWKDDKSKVLDVYEENLALVIPSPIYEQLKDYADRNKYNLKSKVDLLEMLEKNRALLDEI